MTATAENGSEMITNLADPIMFSDPFPRYAELRRVAPVSRVDSRQLNRIKDGYMLTRYDDVMQLHNDVRFSSDLMKQGSPGLMKHLPRMFRLLTDSMVFKDDPDHARLRRLVNKAFTPRMVQLMADDIERLVDELLDRLAAEGDVVDLVSSFATPLPLSVISTMLGVGEADRDAFHSMMERFASSVGGGNAIDVLRSMPTARRLMKMIDRMANDRRTEPDDMLISAIVAASDEGESLNADEVTAMIFLLLLAGHDTTSNLIGSSALALIDHPEQAARLREDDSLAASAVEELLRFTTPVPCGNARITLEETEFAGTVIPKGSSVLGMLISANRDETVFTDPDRLDLGRDPNRHLSFAFGKHFCLGNQLARIEGQMAIRKLVQRFPNMRLAVSRDQLRYKPTQSLRGLRSLPLELRP